MMKWGESQDSSNNDVQDHSSQVSEQENEVEYASGREGGRYIHALVISELLSILIFSWTNM